MNKITAAQRAKMVAGIKRYHRNRKKAANGNGAITDAMPNFDATIEARVRECIRKKVLATLDEMLPA